MGKYQVRPETIEAFQWTGGPDQTEDPEWLGEAFESKQAWFVNEGTPDVQICINSVFGAITVNQGDYIFKDQAGNILSDKKESFEKRYTPVKFIDIELAIGKAQQELADMIKRIYGG